MPEESNKPEKVDDSCLSPDNEDESGCDAKTDQLQRHSRWAGAYAAIKLSTLPREKFRYTDKVTDIFAALSILSLILLVFGPDNSFRPLLTFIFDSLCMLTIVFFVINRLGVLTTISQRKAVLIWDIVLGALLLGMLFAVNFILVLSYFRQLPKMS